MQTTELKSAEKVPIAIDARKMLVRNDCELIHLTLKPGEILEKHSNPFDVAFYVLSGIGELEVGDESAIITPDTVIEVAAGELRGWKNIGKEDLRVLVVKLL
ncbi:MAG: cupin domain-containing protein [Geobacteraceae bacterium]